MPFYITIAERLNRLIGVNHLLTDLKIFLLLLCAPKLLEMKKILFTFIAPVCLLSSCATVVSKTSYPVTINSNPTGATVTITNKKGVEVFKGKSPSTVVLKSSAGYFAKAEYHVKISMPGYTEQTIPVTSSLNGWYFGNLFFGGPLGLLVIDPASGAMWRIDQTAVNVSLSQLTTKTPTLKIMDIANVPDNMKNEMVRIK